MSFDLRLENGDLSISKGDLKIVENSDKLVQDVLKIISTPLGSNRFFPFYGSPLSGSLIGKAFDPQFIRTLTTEQIYICIEKLQKLQSEQIKSLQYVSPQEQIASIENVSLERNANDPRFFFVSLTVISKAFQRVSIPFEVTSA